MSHGVVYQYICLSLALSEGLSICDCFVSWCLSVGQGAGLFVCLCAGLLVCLLVSLSVFCLLV